MVSKIVGIVLIAAGAYLSVTAFYNIQNVVADPGRIESWLVLRDKVHEPRQLEEKKSFLRIEARPSLFTDEQFYVLSGYLSLAIGMFALALMAYIGVAFIGGGVRILRGRGHGSSKK